MRLKQCRLQHDTDFASFLARMDDYPQELNLNVIWAASFWDEKLRELKEKGYGGHPKLAEVEQLIATHKAANYDDGPKWMFFKTNQRVAYAVPIENEHDFNHVINIVTNPAKDNRLACMIRVCRVRLTLAFHLQACNSQLTRLYTVGCGQGFNLHMRRAEVLREESSGQRLFQQPGESGEYSGQPGRPEI